MVTTSLIHFHHKKNHQMTVADHVAAKGTASYAGRSGRRSNPTRAGGGPRPRPRSTAKKCCCSWLFVGSSGGSGKNQSKSSRKHPPEKSPSAEAFNMEDLEFRDGNCGWQKHFGGGGVPVVSVDHFLSEGKKKMCKNCQKNNHQQTTTSARDMAVPAHSCTEKNFSCIPSRSSRKVLLYVVQCDQQVYLSCLW